MVKTEGSRKINQGIVMFGKRMRKTQIQIAVVRMEKRRCSQRYIKV